MTTPAPAAPAPLALPHVRILLVEDDDADAGLVRHGLKPFATRFTLTHCTTLAQAEMWLAASGCDVVLLDLTLPDSTGFATVRRMRAAAPTLPLIVLTGFDNEQVALQAVEAGTQDYLVKGQADGPVMWRSIQHAIARKRLEEELRLSEERLQGIITLAQDAIITADHDMRIVLFNPAAEQLFGYSADAIRGQPLERLLPPEARPGHAAHMRAFERSSDMSRPMSARQEVYGQTATGSRFPAEVSIAKLLHSGGTLYTAIIRDISERLRVETELRRLATTDSLTGLPNRRQFLTVGETELARLHRYARPLGVLMMDVDHFKAINDTHGHAAGDQALITLATICREELRDTDHLGRLGGEEFAILLPETPLPRTVEVAERLRQRLGAAFVKRPSGGAFRFTVSIGVTDGRHGDRSIERALARADHALYQAKRSGRNRVITSDDPA